MLILWFASPFYHSLPENATRSRVPRLTAPMGTPRPHVSRHVSGRAPRRGRRPRRPVFRSLIAGCTRVLHVCLRRPYFFQQRKKYGKERRQKPTVFGFPLSDSNHGTKRFRIESLVPPSPLPLPRTARRCAGLSALRRRVGMPFYKMRFVAARIFYILRPNWPHLHLLPAAASARFDNRLYR